MILLVKEKVCGNRKFRFLFEVLELYMPPHHRSRDPLSLFNPLLKSVPDSRLLLSCATRKSEKYLLPHCTKASCIWLCSQNRTVAHTCTGTYESMVWTHGHSMCHCMAPLYALEPGTIFSSLNGIAQWASFYKQIIKRQAYSSIWGIAGL